MKYEIAGYGIVDESELPPTWSKIFTTGTELGGGLWMGGTDLQHDGFMGGEALGIQDFDAVVTLYADAAPVDWHVLELRLGIWDSELQDHQLEQLHMLAKFAADQVKIGKRVLVRCQAGINRSGLVTGLALRELGMTSANAIDLIRKYRSPICLSNSHFVEYLKELDS